MSSNHFVLREQEYGEFLSVLRKLRADALAKVVFLVDKNGTLLASTGERMTLSASLEGTFWTVQLSSTETWALSRVMLSICTRPLPS